MTSPRSATPTQRGTAASDRTSDSLITSLCREADGVRQRCRQVIAALGSTQEQRLILRLERERTLLLQRLQDLRITGLVLRRQGLRQSISLALLLELCSRPLCT